MSKKGIALLITLLFIIAITVSVGVGMKQIKSTSNEIQNENFMLQTSVILDDVLKLLETSKELKLLTQNSNISQSVDILNIFLAQSAFIPLQAADMKISLEITSARGKLNINTLSDLNTTATQDENPKLSAFKIYLNRYEINVEYGDILVDLMGKVKEDMSYNSDIFFEKPYLFRDFVSSREHLKELDDFYKKRYHENNLKNVDFSKLFSFNSNRDTKIDLNYATPEVFELILDVDRLRAEELSLGGGTYTSVEDLLLNDEEKIMLNRFNVGYFEPILDVKIEIIQNESIAKIHFEYDIKNMKGSNFNYEI